MNGLSTQQLKNAGLSALLGGVLLSSGCEVLNTAAALGMWDEASRRNDLYQQQLRQQQQMQQPSLPAYDLVERPLRIYHSTWHYDGEIHRAYERNCANGRMGIYPGYLEFAGDAVNGSGHLEFRIPFNTIWNIEGAEGSTTTEVRITTRTRNLLFTFGGGGENAKKIEYTIRSYMDSHSAALPQRPLESPSSVRRTEEFSDALQPSSNDVRGYDSLLNKK